MNIYEDQQLEKKFNALADQLGYFLLDILQVSLKRIKRESIIFREFEEIRNHYDEDDVPF